MIDWFVKALNLNPIISWLVTLVGIGVLLLPAVIAWGFCNHRCPQWKFTCMGIGFGLIALPLSLWLYMQYYVGPIRALIFGFLGLFMMIMHMFPFSKVTIPFLLDATDPSCGAWGAQVLKYTIAAGLIWAAIYGALGMAIDLMRRKK